MEIVYKDEVKGGKPKITLDVQRVEADVFYSLGFYKHHYLTAKINKSCKCLLFTWNDEPVAFVGLLNTPRLDCPYSMAISRIVILPDFQGLGLSTFICNFCGGIIRSLTDETHEYKLYIKTAHVKMGEALGRSPKWRGTHFDGKSRTKSDFKRYRNRLERKSYCKEYIGEKIDGYQDLLLPIGEMRAKKANKGTKEPPHQLLFQF